MHMKQIIMPVKTLSLIVPVFNEDATLAYTHQRLLKVLQGPGFPSEIHLEIVYINDGSRDRSAEILNEFLKNNNSKVELRVLHFSRNFGHSAAVLAGLENAKGDFLCIIDADLQDPPEIIPEMLTLILAGNDVVYGQRTSRESESIFKKISAWFFYRLLNRITGVAIPKDTGDFRIITREVRDAVLLCQEPDPFLRGLVAWVGFRQVPFAYKRDPRKYGSTKYPFSKMLKFALKAILNFSTFPLQMVILLGFGTLLLSVGLIGWAIFVHLSGQTVPGWTSLLAIFLFFQAITVLMIGIIGLYVGQSHIGIQKRPRYLIRSQNSSLGGD
jgi:glycosyltransferase involved in cell wall biosynthesis